MIDYDKFRRSLQRLEEQHANHKSLDPSFPVLIREGVAESVIQRFETCYDCLWKVLTRYLVEGLGLAVVPNSPKAVFRLAFQNDLFVAPLSQWFRYSGARIDTAHDYDNEKAEACLELVPDFIADAIDLYETLTETAWRQ